MPNAWVSVPSEGEVPRARAIPADGHTWDADTLICKNGQCKATFNSHRENPSTCRFDQAKTRGSWQSKPKGDDSAG